MGNIKRDTQSKLLLHGIIKGRFIGLSPMTSYFEKQKNGSYKELKEKTALEIFTKRKWAIPEELLNREGMDKGGRPRKTY